MDILNPEVPRPRKKKESKSVTNPLSKQVDEPEAEQIDQAGLAEQIDEPDPAEKIDEPDARLSASATLEHKIPSNY